MVEPTHGLRRITLRRDSLSLYALSAAAISASRFKFRASCACR